MFIFGKIKQIITFIIKSPIFLVLAAFIAFAFGMLFGMGYLRYYVDGDSINRRHNVANLTLNLWENPTFLTGDLNLIKGNQEATISEDGSTVIISRIYSRDNSDLFIAENVNGEWAKPSALSGFINTGYDERGPSLSRDGNWLLFQSNRPDTRGGFDLYMSRRLDDRWSEPINLGDVINSEFDEGFAAFSADNREIYFSSRRPKPEGVGLVPGAEGDEVDWDIYRARIEGHRGEGDSWEPIFSEPEYMRIINTYANEFHVAMPSHGLSLYFVSDREGGMGGHDIYMSRWFEGQYSLPENLGEPINSNKDELYPTFANRGSKLLYVSNVYSIHPRALKLYESASREVLAKIDYELLRNVLLIILMICVAGIAIHYLLKFLLDSELKLLPRCLIASFLLHLILAALTGSLILSSKIEETVTQNLNEMTVNLNALAQESISVAIRESVAALPQLQSPNTVEQVQTEIPLQTESPINNRVTPFPQTVAVSQNVVTSQNFTEVRQTTSQIARANTMQQVAQLNFSNSNAVLESPEGIVQQGDGDQNDPDYREPEPRTIPEQPRFESEPFEPIVAIEGTFEDTLTPEIQSSSIAQTARSMVSGELTTELVRGVRESSVRERVIDFSTSSPTSIAFDQNYGALVFETDFTLEVIEEDEEEETIDEFMEFETEFANRVDHIFGFDRDFEELVRVQPTGEIGEVQDFERLREIEKRVIDPSLGRVGGEIADGVELLVMGVDSELEIPEYMLDE